MMFPPKCEETVNHEFYSMLSYAAVNSLTIYEEPNSFRWRAKMMAGFLFTNDKTFELEETSSGTRLIHKELFNGMLVPLFWSKLNEYVPSNVKLNE